MLKFFFPNFLSFTRRRWAYAVVEVSMIAVFALTSSVAVVGRGFRIGLLDPGMARITAMCFMAVSASIFIVTVCLKQKDSE